jgi:hypothetical protein
MKIRPALYIVASLFVATAILAGCGGQAPVTKLADNVPSYCIESREERNSFKDFCDATRNCKAADITKADSLAKQGADFCAGSPENTAANRDKIKAILSQQRAVGYAQ